MADGFPIYKPDTLRKINGIRRTISMPSSRDLPILDNGSVGFSSAADAHGEPRSCLNCFMYNSQGKTCQIMGPSVHIDKLTCGAGQGSKDIEYWPVCSYWIYGEPRTEADHFHAALNPSDAGLIWVNAPKVGQVHGGSNCGGENGGDDCDYWSCEGDDKRACPTGFCRVLQRDTENGACCSCWTDDDRVEWNVAQEHFKRAAK